MEHWQSLRIADFNLHLTLSSGQFFRYYEHGEQYVLLTMGRAVTVMQRGSVLYFRGADEQFVRTLFQLRPQHTAQLRKLKQDQLLQRIIFSYPGLRLMRQDLHEAILGFICSSQSNIPKIRMNLHLLAASCGEYADGHHYLPAPGKDLQHEAVLSAKTGFRAKYIVKTNKILTKELLDEIKEAKYERSHELLCALPGIGPKIADCICLFALGQGEAFPVDVHVMRAMKVLFPRARFMNTQQVKACAQRRWGKNAGLAQQLIYQWARDQLSSDVKRNRLRITAIFP